MGNSTSSKVTAVIKGLDSELDKPDDGALAVGAFDTDAINKQFTELEDIMDQTKNKNQKQKLNLQIQGLQAKKKKKIDEIMSRTVRDLESDASSKLEGAQDLEALNKVEFAKLEELHLKGNNQQATNMLESLKLKKERLQRSLAETEINGLVDEAKEAIARITKLESFQWNTVGNDIKDAKYDRYEEFVSNARKRVQEEIESKKKSIADGEMGALAEKLNAKLDGLSDVSQITDEFSADAEQLLREVEAYRKFSGNEKAQELRAVIERKKEQLRTEDSRRKNDIAEAARKKRAKMKRRDKVKILDPESKYFQQVVKILNPKESKGRVQVRLPGSAGTALFTPELLDVVEHYKAESSGNMMPPQGKNSKAAAEKLERYGGPWNFYISYARNDPNAVAVAERLSESLDNIWFDVKMKDTSTEATEHGVCNSTILLALITDDSQEDTGTFKQEECCQEIRWALGANSTIQPLILSQDKGRVHDFRSTAPSDLKKVLDGDCIPLKNSEDPSDVKFWDDGVDKVMTCLRNATAVEEKASDEEYPDPTELPSDGIVQELLSNPKLELTSEQSIECLTTCIGIGKSRADEADNLDCIVMLGNTGAGKSTFANYM